MSDTPADNDLARRDYNFVLEQLIDRGCAELGADPVEWRKKWHKGVGDDGWCPGCLVGLHLVQICTLPQPTLSCMEFGIE